MARKVDSKQMSSIVFHDICYGPLNSGLNLANLVREHVHMRISSKSPNSDSSFRNLIENFIKSQVRMLRKINKNLINCEKGQSIYVQKCKNVFRVCCHGFRYDTANVYPLNPNCIVVHKTNVLESGPTAVQCADHRKSKNQNSKHSG